MQMTRYLGATIKDLSISEGAQYVELRGKQIALFQQKTGFGYRSFLVCPECGKRVAELLLPTYNDKICCQYCSGYHLEKYSPRTNLNDQASTELIDYYIGKIEDKLSLCYHQDIPFDYADYEAKRPKGMRTHTFKKNLAKLDTLYWLRNEALKKGRGPTAKEIKPWLSDIHCECFWLFDKLR